MKAKGLLWTAVALFALGHGASIADTASGLTACYTLDGHANDMTGNGNDGIIYGATTTTDRFGKAGGALDFDGNDDYVDIAFKKSLEIGQASVSVNVWLRDWYNSDAVYLGGDDESGGSYASRFAVDPWDVRVRPDGQSDSVDCYDYVDPDQPSLSTDGWHMLTAVWDRAAGLSIFWDGALVAYQVKNTSMCTFNPLRRVLLGAYQSSADLSIYNGQGGLDEVRIYKRALSGADVTELYKSTKSDCSSTGGGVGGAGGPYTDVATVGDVNGNASHDFAVLRVSPLGSPQVIIKDSGTGKTVRTIGLGGDVDLVPIAISPAGDLNWDGVAEFGVLVTSKSTGNTSVIVVNPKNGTIVKRIAYPRAQ